MHVLNGLRKKKHYNNNNNGKRRIEQNDIFQIENYALPIDSPNKQVMGIIALKQTFVELGEHQEITPSAEEERERERVCVWAIGKYQFGCMRAHVSYGVK